MPKINEKLEALLEKREFVSVATATKDGIPNTVPKFFFRAKGDFIYLIDYVVGQTISNLKKNPMVSISFMDLDNLEAYRMNGTAQIIEKGRVFETILAQWDKKLLKFSTDRVIEAIKTGKKSHHFELEMTEKFVVLKIKVDHVIKIGRRGDIWKESI